MRKPNISRRPLFATNSTINRAKKPICSSKRAKIKLCKIELTAKACRSVKVMIAVTMQALLFHLSARSTKPNVAGATSGLLLGCVTPCSMSWSNGTYCVPLAADSNSCWCELLQTLHSPLHTANAYFWEGNSTRLFLCHFGLKPGNCDQAWPTRAVDTLLAEAALEPDK